MKVKLILDCDDADLSMTPGRDVQMKDTLDIKTKSKLRIHEVVAKKDISILCVDDQYWNLEVLKVVFDNLGLEDQCVFLSDGQ